METSPRESLRLQWEPAVLVSVRLPGSLADFEDPLGELRALAESAGVRVVGELFQNRRAPRGRTYLGKGKVEELRALVAELGATIVIFDNELAPSQIQELEKELLAGAKGGAGVKILDRSEVILDIFANRASTRQAQLQVEIAQLEYTAPRLRAMWSHLGQVTGGAPVGVGTRGPGEQQIEIDRRLVQRRLLQLQRELADVQARKSREVQARRDHHFTAGLVGYTNAGKSSLFNALTAGGAYANDQLFATLHTRVERWNLGGGNEAMLSDTVGFVRDLPHHLVASFRSTLEDAIHAHVLLIVIDVSDRQSPQHWRTVTTVLEEIGATEQPRLVLLNKVDLWGSLTPDQRAARRSPQEWIAEVPDAIPVSARTGEGLPEVAARVLAMMVGEVRECVLILPIAQGRAIDLLEKRCPILSREYVGDRVEYRVRIGRRQAELIAGAPGLLVNGERPEVGLPRLFDGQREGALAARRVPPHERLSGEPTSPPPELARPTRVAPGAVPASDEE